MILSIHLKRFTPMGRKMGHPIKYDEQLSLQHIMSEGQFGPTYSLYGVISHAGGGPNSGHYYAHVKSAQGQWHEMNDESVTRVFNPPTSMKNAYVLFYIRNKGQALQAAVSAPTARVSTPTAPMAPVRTGVVAAMKKRKVVEEVDGDKATSKSFIGPRLPSPAPDRESSPPESKKRKPNPPDPQAQVLKQKIAAQTQSPGKANPTTALLSLAQYTDNDDSDDVGEKVEEKMDEDPAPPAAPHSPVLTSPTLTEPLLPPSSTAVSSASSINSNTAAIPAASFYSTSGSKFKGKNGPGGDAGSEDIKKWAKTPIENSPRRPHPTNPFGRGRLTNTLNEARSSGSGVTVVKRPKKRSMAV